MHLKERMVAVYIPEALIPGIRSFKGEVLLNLNHMVVEGGFSLRPGEFVTSVSEYERMIGRVGLKDRKHDYNVRQEPNTPSE